MERRWLVVGLGNPGDRYRRNRHNIGFMFADFLADRLGAPGFTRQRTIQGEKSSCRHQGDQIILLKPETYMNLSGHAVSAACAYYKILPRETVICYDDVDIPLGSLRIRVKGSAGGHNGVASIIEQVGASFVRLRLGIGPDGDRSRAGLAGYVLSDFHPDEQQALTDVFDGAFGALKLILAGKTNEAMNRYNRRIAPDKAADDDSER